MPYEPGSSFPGLAPGLKSAMKILHLATHDNFGGAARAAYRQHLALRDHGIDSRMLVRHKHSNDANVAVYSGDSSFSCRAARVLRRAWISYKEKQSRKDCRQIICGLNDPRADLLRSVDRRIAEADVINIHKVEHFVDLPALLRPPSSLQTGRHYTPRSQSDNRGL